LILLIIKFIYSVDISLIARTYFFIMTSMGGLNPWTDNYVYSSRYEYINYIIVGRRFGICSVQPTKELSHERGVPLSGTLHGEELPGLRPGAKPGA
jgi:hypothetical protein